MSPKSPSADLLDPPVESSTGLAVPQGDAFVSMVERLAANKDVDVDKLQRLLDMQERILNRNAESAFNSAFAEMQAELPTIGERGRTDKTTYAPLEDIIGAVRPVLKKFGFAISHRTEWPNEKTVKVVGVLTHRDGHSRTSEFLSAADQTGSKNAIQALGSAVAYGRRYTTKDLLCIVTADEDDDAEGSQVRTDVQAPEGFDAWLGVLEGITTKPEFINAWNKSKPEYRTHLTRTNQPKLKAMRQKVGIV